MVSAQRELSYRGKEMEGCGGVRKERLGGGGEDRGKGSHERPGFTTRGAVETEFICTGAVASYPTVDLI